MWVYIKKEHVDEYLQQYPLFEKEWESIILLATPDAYFLPRLFIYNYPSHLLNVYYGKKEITPTKINLKFKGQLRKLQHEAWNIVKNQYELNGYINGILKLFPGAGKTVLSVYIASQLGYKTCIIVDGDNLLKQWVEAFINFSNIRKEDIGIIKGNIHDTNKPIVIAMVQTLSSRLTNNTMEIIKKINDARFGLVFYDEVHESANTEKRSKVSVLFRTLNFVGLSATPFATGLQKILMTNTVGEIIYNTKEYDNIPKYYFVYYHSNLTKINTKYQYVLNKMDYIKRKAFWNSISIKSERYLRIIPKYINNLLKHDHKTIVICSTHKQVNAISKKLDELNIKHTRFYGKERNIDKINDDVIVATYSFTGKGFDMPRLSSLILACPLAGKKSIIQVVGRILRSKEGKQEPIVIDLIDMDFPGFFLSEVKKKISIINNEFDNCEIYDFKEED